MPFSSLSSLELDLIDTDFPVMVTESAIALLDTSKLTPLAREGGVLTPVSAFGDEIVKRLEASGRFQFESTILGN